MKITEFDQKRPKVLSSVNQYFNTKARGYEVGDPANASLHETLEKLGWNYLDDGSFSKVYTHPRKNYVLKISKRQDTGFVAFVNLVKRHPQEAHFPKISYQKLTNVDGKIHGIYLIEKLRPLSDEYDVKTADEIAYCVEARAENPHASSDTIFVNDFDISFVMENPSLLRAAKIVGLEKKDNRLDIHSENIMIRPKTDILVITDPYANRADFRDNDF